MRRRAGSTLVLSLAFSALILSGSSDAGEDSRVGVVSILRVFDGYKKVADIRTQLDQEFSKQTKALEERAKNLKEWERKLTLEGPPKRNREKKVELQKYELETIDLKRDFRELAGKVEKRRMEEMKQVLREVRSAIKAVALAGKFDLIVRAPEYDEEGKNEVAEDKQVKKQEVKGATELLRRFKDDSVAFNSPPSDVTQTVIALLNKEYTATKK